MSTQLHSSAKERLAYTRDDVAGLLQVSLRHVAALEATGRLGPRKLKFGRAVRYLASEVHAWLEAGAPARDKWDAMKAGRASMSRHTPRTTSKQDFGTEMALNDIQPSPQNDKLYGPVDPKDPSIIALAKSIKTIGLPPVTLQEIVRDATVNVFDTDLFGQDRVVRHGGARTPKASGQTLPTCPQSDDTPKSQPVSARSSTEKNRAAEDAAKIVGMSWRTAETAAKAVAEIDKAEQADDAAKLDAIRKTVCDHLRNIRFDVEGK